MQPAGPLLANMVDAFKAPHQSTEYSRRVRANYSHNKNYAATAHSILHSDLTRVDAIPMEKKKSYRKNTSGWID